MDVMLRIVHVVVNHSKITLAQESLRPQLMTCTEKIKDLVRTSRRLTIRKLPEEVGITVWLRYDILTKKISLPRVAAEFLPRLITE